MLLVTKVGPKHPGTWAAAGPTNRIVMIDVRDKKKALTKPVASVTWTEHPGISAKDKDMVITAAERAIARLEVADEKAKLAKGKKAPPKKKPGARAGFVSWVAGGRRQCLRGALGQAQLGFAGSHLVCPLEGAALLPSRLDCVRGL